MTTLFVAVILTIQAWAGGLAEVDLHAHLFFHEGVGIAWWGSFTGPIRSESWRDRLKSKVNREDLIASDAKIVVVALYGHSAFLGGARASIRRQILEAETFVHEMQPDWVIARSPQQARQALAQGRRILIFSLEGADEILETDADIQEFIQERGIRIVTPMHFAQDQFGGAALMPGFAGLASPTAWFQSWFRPLGEGQVRVSQQGMSERARWLIKSLLARGVWIDLSHASDRWQSDAFPLLDAAQQPPLYTHTSLRRYYASERGISAEQLKRVATRQGLVGVIPSSDMVRYGPEMDQCPGGLKTFSSQWKEVQKVLLESGSTSKSPSTLPALGLGSDINAPLNFIGSDCEGKSSDWSQYSQIAQLALTLGQSESNQRSLRLNSERFLEIWSRVRSN
jgi:microsomal dipeptidase-like Zn-dependent dipeptidase